MIKHKVPGHYCSRAYRFLLSASTKSGKTIVIEQIDFLSLLLLLFSAIQRFNSVQSVCSFWQRVAKKECSKAAAGSSKTTCFRLWSFGMERFFFLVLSLEFLNCDSCFLTVARSMTSKTFGRCRFCTVAFYMGQ